MIDKFDVGDMIGSCELSASDSIIGATAGKSSYFFNARTRELLKEVKTAHDVSSVSLHAKTRRFVAGGSSDTWVRVYDFDEEKELEVYKGHHGSIWSVSFSPDGNLYATGSEDGTIKLVSLTTLLKLGTSELTINSGSTETPHMDSGDKWITIHILRDYRADG